MTTPGRYRVENGRWWIDIKVSQSRQLFDFRDPAPFRERDLDDDAVDYLLAAADEIPLKQPVAIMISITDEPEPRLAPEAIVDAIGTHFRHQLEQITRKIREHLRRGQLSLAVGLSVLICFLTLAELVASLPAGAPRQILREGFVITGWVAMWRPLELLLYDWRPMVDDRKRIARLLDAPVSIRYSS